MATKEKTALTVGSIVGLALFLFLRRQAGAAPDPTKGIIYGRVVAAEPPEEPIAGATVEIIDYASTKTDSNGYYRFVNIEPGDYTMQASHPDRQDSDILYISVDAGSQQQINFRLYPFFAELTGVVTDATTGKPIETIKVEVNGSVAGTKSDGSYTVKHIIPGTYTVFFVDPDMRYANTTVPAVGIPLEGATLNMQLSPLAPGAIQVSTSPVVEGVAITVSFYRHDLGHWILIASGKTNSAGQCFFADIPEGNYKVSASHIDYERVEQQVTVKPDQTTTTTIRLTEATTVGFLRVSWREKDTLKEIYLEPGTVISVFDAETHELVHIYQLQYPSRSEYLKELPLGYHYIKIDIVRNPEDVQYEDMITTPFLIARSGPKQYYDWGEVWPGHPECIVRLRLEPK